MKILFFNYEYPPLGGGAANATFHILRELSKIENLEIDLVTSSHDDKYYLEKIAKNIYIHKLAIGKKDKNLHFQSVKDLFLYTWKAYFYSKKLIKKNKYDLSHSFFSVPCGIISFLFKKKYDLPYIISLRGADVPGYAERFSFLYKFIKPIIKKIWESSFAVVSNSKGLRELALRSKPDQNIHIIYNGVDVDNFRPLNSEINEKIYSKKKDFIVTPGASRITSRKGLIYLIEAVGKVFLKHPEILLEIMGDGSKEEKKELKDVAEKNKIKNRVVFLGRIPREKTFSYYQRADVFALPSLNEGMSNAMLEALATGLPIVSTDTGGAKELVGEGVNGYIVKMRNSQDIADRLERLIIDSNLRKKMGEESRKKAENFSWKKVAEKYFELYEKTKK